MEIQLPKEVVNKIFLYTSSTCANIIKQSKYYGVSCPFRKLREVSKLPRKCSIPIRHDYYKIYLERFYETIQWKEGEDSMKCREYLMRVPTTEEFRKCDNDTE